MGKNITIRKATAEDVPAIVELWKELIDFHKECDRLFSRSENGHKAFTDWITGHISSDTSCVFVAEAGMDIVGYCLAIVEKYPPVLEIKKYGLIQDIAVTGAYRRGGIGERLLKEAKGFFREKGLRRIETRVAINNKLSTGFWAKMGFKPYLETAFMEI
jgi:ribosomal protein S18 acetylase RimI-like enzyme